MGDASEASPLIEELIHQFTDPFAFYRELIQNSIDAGSSRIEVTLSYRPSPAGLGLCLATVADWGEGMSRDVIENYLVTKFRSTKQDDFTKIGKFGIGFVSVFACQPDAVAVDTGRDGQSWRVLFKKSTAWELLALGEPVEGTRVALHKEMSAADYDAFVARSLDAVKRWCRHSEADVVFAAGGRDGGPPPPPEAVKEPFVVDAPYQVEHHEEGTHIIAGPSRASEPLTGFYNRGLTLLETTERHLDGVALKIVSRYLEHTLTRDNVKREKNFARAMALAKKLATGPLLAALPEELKKAADRKDGAADWLTLFSFALSRLEPSKLWLRQTGGGAVSFEEVRRSLGKQRELVISLEPTPLVERMRLAGSVVLELSLGRPLQALKALVRAKEIAVAEQRFTYAEPPVAPQPPGFASAVVSLLTTAGAKVKDAMVAEVRGAAKDEPFVVLEAPGRPAHADEARASPFSRRAPGLLVFNHAHPSIAAAEPLFARAPRLAAVLMGRLVLVRSSKLDDAADRRLTEWALT